jgi:hypothetical protein
MHFRKIKAKAHLAESIHNLAPSRANFYEEFDLSGPGDEM